MIPGSHLSDIEGTQEQTSTVWGRAEDEKGCGDRVRQIRGLSCTTQRMDLHVGYDLHPRYYAGADAPEKRERVSEDNHIHRLDSEEY